MRIGIPVYDDVELVSEHGGTLKFREGFSFNVATSLKGRRVVSFQVTSTAGGGNHEPSRASGNGQ
jgi:hypothetical protein